MIDLMIAKLRGGNYKVAYRIDDCQPDHLYVPEPMAIDDKCIVWPLHLVTMRRELAVQIAGLFATQEQLPDDAAKHIARWLHQVITQAPSTMIRITSERLHRGITWAQAAAAQANGDA